MVVSEIVTMLVCVALFVRVVVTVSVVGLGVVVVEDVNVRVVPVTLKSSLADILANIESRLSLRDSCGSHGRSGSHSGDCCANSRG